MLGFDDAAFFRFSYSILQGSVSPSGPSALATSQRGLSLRDMTRRDSDVNGPAV